MLLVTFLFVAITLLAIYLFKKNDKIAGLGDIKGPPRLPLLGNVHQIYNPEAALEVALKFGRKYGPNFILCLGSEVQLVTFDPQLLELVTSSSTLIKKSHFYDFSKDWLGDGLVTSSGNKWHHFRKILTPGFHYKILEDFVEIFDRSGDKLVRKLADEVDNPSLEIFGKITLCTLDIICETAMGVSMKAQDCPNSEVVKAMKTMCDLMYRKGLTFYRFSGFLFRWSKYYAFEKEALRVLKNYSNEIIETRRNVLLEKSGGGDGNCDEFGVKKKRSFLDILLESTFQGRPLTNEEIREQVDTFVFEGHDTTASAISFTLYELSRHPHIQKKVYDEIKAVLKDSTNCKFTYNALQEMKYLEMVIKEALRLYPSVPVIGRELTEPVEYDGKILPQGLQLAIGVYFLHRQPHLFPDPEVFDPERFSLENSRNRHPYAYIPFSAGPRNCIGQKFAMLELKVTIAKILWNYELLPARPEHRIHCVSKVTIQSSNGIKLSLKRREVLSN